MGRKGSKTSKSSKKKKEKKEKKEKENKEEGGEAPSEGEEPAEEPKDEKKKDSKDSTGSKKRKKSEASASSKKRKKSASSKGKKKKKKKPKLGADGVPIPGEEMSDSGSGSDASTTRSADVSTITSSKAGGGGDEGRDDQDYREMYRPWNKTKDYATLLPPVYKAFLKFFPWPPRKGCYFSSGYYFDLDNGDGMDLKENELMIHNLPSGMTPAALKKEFPGAKGVTINANGTTIVEFKTPSEATGAYNNSKLVKLGKNHLGWVKPDELYLLSVPPNVSEDDLTGDFPDATQISFQPGPDGNQIATAKFRSLKDADANYEDAPYKKLGNHQLGYSISINPLTITNLPPGMGEGDIKKKFPTAKTVEINKATGTAKVVFENDEAALKGYDNTDLLKLGKPKLGWLRPEELYIEDVPKSVSESDLMKEYPTAKKVKFQKGAGGKRIATVIFANEDEQKKAYDASTHTKLGPQRLGWTPDGAGPGGKGGKGGGGGKDSQLKLTNLPSGISEDDLKKKFPGATGVKLGKDSGKRIATILFASEDEQKKAYDASKFKKVGPQLLGFTPDGMTIGKESKKKAGVTDADIDTLTDDELGRKLWQLGPTGFSNISNIFTPAINISGLPSDVNRTALLKLFPKAKKVDIFSAKGGKVAQVEFQEAKDAAHAYGVSTKLELDGHRLTVKPVTVGKKDKGKDGSKGSKAGKSKSSKKGKKK